MMQWSLYCWLWILIYLNLFGVQGSIKNEQITSTRNINYLDGEYYDDIINASNRHFFGTTTGNHALIRDIHTDIKKMMRTIPLVASNISESGHEITELKRLFYGVLEDIRYLKEQVKVIRHQTSHIWKNVSDARHHLNRMNLKLKDVDDIAKYTNSSIENLTERYEKVRADFNGVHANYDNISDDVRVLKKNNVMIEALLPVVNTFVKDTYIKLDKILSDQETIYSIIMNNEHTIRSDITRLENKMDSGFMGLGNEFNVNNKNLLTHLEYIINQVVDFRGYIEKICHQNFPGMSKNIYHNNNRNNKNRISNDTTNLKPIIEFINEKYKYLQSKNKTPIVGTGAIGGAGQITGIPGIIDNYLGTFGGVGGFALYPESAVNLTLLLRKLAKEPIISNILSSSMTTMTNTNTITNTNTVTITTTTTTTTPSTLFEYIPSLDDLFSGSLDTLGITTTAEPNIMDLIDSIDINQIISELTPDSIITTTIATTAEIPGAFPIIPGFPEQHPYPMGTARPAINFSPIPVFPGQQTTAENPSVSSNNYQTTPSSYYSSTASSNYNLPTQQNYYQTPSSNNYQSQPQQNYYQTPSSNNYQSQPQPQPPTPQSPGYPPMQPGLFIEPYSHQYPQYSTMYPNVYPTQPTNYPNYQPQQPVTLPPGKPPAYPIGIYPGYPITETPSISNIPVGQGYPHPIPTQSTTSRPFVPPLPTSTPYPPTLIEPVIPLGTGSLMGRCACICPCNCSTCPAIPVSPDPPTTLTPAHSWWSSYDGFPTRAIKNSCQCLCACPCPRNTTFIPPDSILLQPQYTSRRSTTLSLYEEAVTTDRWPPEPDTPSRPLPRPNNNNHYNDNNQCCQDITNDIRGVKEDIRMMTITMRDEIAVVKQTVMSQIDIKFEELKYILADIHHTSLDFHNENKADAEDIKKLIKFEFQQSNTLLNTFSQHVNHLTTTNTITPDYSQYQLYNNDNRNKPPAWYKNVKKPLFSNWNSTNKILSNNSNNNTNNLKKENI